MESLIKIVDVIELALLILLGLSVVYVAAFSFAGLFYRKPKAGHNNKKNKFLILIPSYKEDSVIYDVALNTTKVDYPDAYRDIVVIADWLKPETVEKLRTLPIEVNEVNWEKSSKIKSINATLANIDDNKYDYVLILDADNLIAPDALAKFNDEFNKGARAIQGHRTARNKNTSMAVLDALSEEINNHIFRKGHRALGFSSALIGSGMAFEFKLYKDMNRDIDSYGEDKELEFKLLKERIKISYLSDADILDEKVAKGEVFSNQRSRWLANQLNFAIGHGKALGGALLSFNCDLADKIIQHFVAPRVILLGVVTILTALALLFGTMYHMYWLYMWGVLLIALALGVPRKMYSLQTLKALLYLPVSFFLLGVSIVKMRQASKGFVHTEHSAK